MNKLSFILAFIFCSVIGFGQNKQIKIVFNSNKEARKYASKNDTAYIMFVSLKPGDKSAYQIHNLSVYTEGYNDRKERQTDTSRIPDMAPSRNLLIKIPFKNYIKTGSVSRIYIQIESVRVIKNGKPEQITIPLSELRQEFIIN